MTTQNSQAQEPENSSRFTVIVYSLFAAFLVILTLSYFWAGHFMDWMEWFVRKVFM